VQLKSLKIIAGIAGLMLADKKLFGVEGGAQSTARGLEFEATGQVRRRVGVQCRLCATLSKRKQEKAVAIGHSRPARRKSPTRALGRHKEFVVADDRPRARGDGGGSPVSSFCAGGWAPTVREDDDCDKWAELAATTVRNRPRNRYRNRPTPLYHSRTAGPMQRRECWSRKGLVPTFKQKSEIAEV
jgi:hypothetical protein